MKEDIMRLTFPSYESASQRSGVVTSSPTPCISEAESTIPDKYNLYCVENITPLLSSTGGLIGLLLSPYAIAPITLYLISSLQHNSTLLEASSLFLPATALICLVNIIVYTFDRPISHISGRIGFNSIGATTLPGLYHSESSFIVDLLAKCPLLTASTTIHGSLPFLPSTPWILSGDMRTLLPFLSYKPRPISYIRRWVRVPLADGPLDGMSVKDENGQIYESVALDCSYADKQFHSELLQEKIATGVHAADGNNDRLQTGLFTENDKNTSSNNASSERNYVLLILAGLTGGSGEGYVVDLVNTANKQGIDCYVMLGRGLGDTPNLSEAAFHGARTSDVREAARVLRQILPTTTKIFVVGISMGGIIVTNAVGRSVLTGLVDGAISVSGCFDTAKNMNFTHSRTFWQPLLAFGLKESFVAPIGALRKMSRRMGPLAAEIINKTKDVIAFDSCVVTALHGFRDVYHYYSDMSGCNDQRLLSMISGEKPKTENQDPGSHKNEKISKNEIENENKNKIEIESVEYVLTKEKSNQESGPRSSDVVPFVCLQTVVRDVKAANKIEEKKKNEKIEKNEVNKLDLGPECQEDSDWIRVASKESKNENINDLLFIDTNFELKKESSQHPICHGLPLPLLCLHAADDPIIHVDTMPCRIGIAKAIDNMICLVTSRGGHVGWPVGWRPWVHRWKFQNLLILEFCHAILEGEEEREEKE